MSAGFTRDLIRLITLAPDGVQSRRTKPEEFVVSSVNLGIVQAGTDTVTVVFSPRSSVGSLQEELKERLTTLADSFGYATAFSGEYPGWAYTAHSPIREVCCAVWRELFGQELRTEAIHAGLECGLFQEKLPGLDAIAIGPAMTNVHTPDETLDMASCGRVYRMVCRVLERLAAGR